METDSDQVLILPWEGTEGAETLQPLEPGALASPLTYLRTHTVPLQNLRSLYFPPQT